jgi:hypothetical protein
MLGAEPAQASNNAPPRAAQDSESTYWPDDVEIREELASLSAYRGLRRGRLCMVLEAIEDHLRGWIGEQAGLGGERVARGADGLRPRACALSVSLVEIPCGEVGDVISVLRGERAQTLEE